MGPFRVVVVVLAGACALVAQDLVPDTPEWLPRPLPEDVRPNVLVLVGDDMGMETVGIYAEHPDPGRTPVLDALASQGVLFRNAWSSPSCSPTRANLITGRQGWRTGIGSVIAYEDFDLELSRHETSLADVLAEQGYRTGAVGKWHLGVASGSGLAHPHALGFEHFRGTTENLPNGDPLNYSVWDKVTDGSLDTSVTYATTAAVDDALELIDHYDDDPWFVYLAFHAPHSPYHAPPRGLHTYDLPTNPSDDFALHARAMAEAMDTEIGRLLASLDPEVLARTYIVFVGDNGTAPPAVVPPYDVGKVKNSLYEGGINVPLLVAGPGLARGESAALVHVTDLFATVCDLTGADDDAALDSVSFLSALLDPSGPSPRPWVHAERFRPNGAGPWITFARAVRNDRFKLRVHWQNGVLTEIELFDLVSDPGETQNVLADGVTPQEQQVLDVLQGYIQSLGGGP